MPQQTAVEWLEEQLNKWSDGKFYLPPHLFEQAKQMEKEQILNAYFEGYTYGGHEVEFNGQQYYNETYES